MALFLAMKVLKPLKSTTPFQTGNKAQNTPVQDALTREYPGLPTSLTIKREGKFSRYSTKKTIGKHALHGTDVSVTEEGV